MCPPVGSTRGCSPTSVDFLYTIYVNSLNALSQAKVLRFRENGTHLNLLICFL